MVIALPRVPLGSSAHLRPSRRCCQCATDCCLPSASLCSDNLRSFFEQCFPTLLKRLFGYDGTSWLNLVAQVQCQGAPDWALLLMRWLLHLWFLESCQQMVTRKPPFPGRW